MDNNTFRKWISWKMEQTRKDLAGDELDEQGRKSCESALKLLEEAERMARYTAGPAFRRFRKDYERRLARLGQQRLATYEAEGAALK